MRRPVTVLCASAIDPTSEDHTRYGPLWPAYLGAYAKKSFGDDGVRVIYFNGNLEQDISTGKPDIVALSAVTQNFGIAREMAAVAKRHDLPVLVGGMHISSLPQSLTADMDIACIGEGEQTFVDMIRLHMRHGGFKVSELDGIPGIAFRKGGELIATGQRDLIPNLDDIPHPDRSIIGYGRSRDYIYTARGCPYNCVFCACRTHWGGVRYASPRYVIEEIQELMAHGVPTIRFNDDNLPANGERLHAISRLIVEHGIYRKVRFSCWARASDITEDAVASLKAMNVVSVMMGLESGNDRVLRSLKGQASVEGNRRAVELLKDAGIQANADFILGSPSESREEVMDTYRFIRSSRLDFVTPKVFVPLPGTPAWKLAEGRGLVSENMDFRRCSFHRGTDPSVSVHVSEKLTPQELGRLYRKFERLALRRSIRALPRSPWLREIPGLVRRKFAGRLAHLFGGRRGTVHS